MFYTRVGKGKHEGIKKTMAGWLCHFASSIDGNGCCSAVLLKQHFSLLNTGFFFRTRKKTHKQTHKLLHHLGGAYSPVGVPFQFDFAVFPWCVGGKKTSFLAVTTFHRMQIVKFLFTIRRSKQPRYIHTHTHTHMPLHLVPVCGTTAVSISFLFP